MRGKPFRRWFIAGVTPDWIMGVDILYSWQWHSSRRAGRTNGGDSRRVFVMKTFLICLHAEGTQLFFQWKYMHKMTITISFTMLKSD